MGRSWLALLVLVVSVGSAEAKRIACDPQPITLSTASGPLQLGLRGDLRWLDDGDEPFGKLTFPESTDKTPPATPSSVRLAVSSDSGDRSEWMDVSGTYDADTAFILVTLEQGQNRYFFVTTPDETAVCSHGNHFTPTPVSVSIVAVDLAGNRSAPLELSLPTVDGAKYPTHVRCGMGSLVYIFVIPFVLLLVLLIALVVASVRQTHIRKMPGEHVSIPLGESVARVVARSYVIKSVIGIVGTMALLEIDYTVSAVIVGFVSALWLVRLMRAGMLVARFEKPVNRLERREDWLVVDHSLLYCGRRAWNRAAKLPAASLAKR